MSPPFRSVRPLLGEERGSAAVQFALVSPLLLLLVFGGFEVAIALFVSGSLEAAVLAASRVGATGFTTKGVTRERMIAGIIEARTFGWVKAKEADIRTLIYSRFEDIGQPESYVDKNFNGRYDGGEPFSDVNGNGKWDSDMGRAGLGGPNDIVLYDVQFTAGPITGLVRSIVPAFLHRATVAVRNEPY